MKILKSKFLRLFHNPQGTDNGCYSLVGYQRRQQPLNLAHGCLYTGIIVHELLHGKFHIFYTLSLCSIYKCIVRLTF